VPQWGGAFAPLSRGISEGVSMRGKRKRRIAEGLEIRVRDIRFGKVKTRAVGRCFPVLSGPASPGPVDPDRLAAEVAAVAAIRHGYLPRARRASPAP
jgi:hypothetical protein